MEKKYTNGEITIVWKPDVCIHSAICFKGLHSVFNPTKRPWVNVEGANTEKIVAQVDKCPSKALSYYKNQEENQQEIKMETTNTTKVEVIPNGPVMLEGKLVVKDATGAEVEKEKIFLCRCGGSSKKPYCDGTHKKIDFKD
jgi:uncharacterized Fe-S cluster protein YjdI